MDGLYAIGPLSGMASYAGLGLADSAVGGRTLRTAVGGLEPFMDGEGLAELGGLISRAWFGPSHWDRRSVRRFW